MTALAIVIACISGGITLIWASRHLMVSRASAEDNVLRPGDPGPPEQAPRIEVYVACKDEQDNIGPCVESMLRQDYPNFTVTVINDRSDDRTGEVAREIAARDPRVKVIDIESLPPGWCGKNHAMWTGIAAGEADWICMIDADCQQDSDRTLSTAMQYALDHRADLLSVLPKLKMRGFWENVVQPVCGAIMVFWFRPEEVNDPAKPDAYANGAFMLMRRDAYQAIGNHEAVKDQVNEDMHMALRIKQQGKTLRVVQNDGLYQVRMYTSLKQIVNGWSRIFFGCFGTMRRLMISLAVMSIMGVGPYLLAIGSWLGVALGGGGPWLAAALVSTAAVGMQQSLIWRFYKLAQARQVATFGYSLGCSVAIVALIKAIGKLRSGGKIVWRNTTYTTGQNQ